ncbi:glycine-rich domain-containing protein [Tsuneonella sp. HG222]
MIKNGQQVLDTDFIILTTAGEALSARDACYISSSDGKAYKCDADDLTKIDFKGFAQEGAALNATVRLVPEGMMTGFTGLTQNGIYFLSGTAGAITTTAPTNKRIVGVAMSTTTIKLFTGFSRIELKTFTTPGANTWTKYPGLAMVFVKVQAAGGGSGGATNEFTCSGAGGAYTEGWLSAASLAATETATVGAGGTAGTSSGNGGTGGTSSFGTHLVCAGGVGSTRGSATPPSGGTVSTAGSFSMAGSTGSFALRNDDGGTVEARIMQGPGVGYLSGWVPATFEDGNDRDYYGPTGRGYGYGGRITGQDSQPSGIAGQAGGQGIIIVEEYYI